MYCVRVSTRHCDPQLLYSVWAHYERILTSYSTLHNHAYRAGPSFALCPRAPSGPASDYLSLYKM